MDVFAESDFALYHARKICSEKYGRYDKDATIYELPLWELIDAERGDEKVQVRTIEDDDFLMVFIDWMVIGDLLKQIDSIFTEYECKEIREFVAEPKTSRVLAEFIKATHEDEQDDLIVEYPILALFRED